MIVKIYDYSTNSEIMALNVGTLFYSSDEQHLTVILSDARRYTEPATDTGFKLVSYKDDGTTVIDTYHKVIFENYSLAMTVDASGTVTYPNNSFRFRVAEV